MKNLLTYGPLLFSVLAAICTLILAGTFFESRFSPPNMIEEHGRAYKQLTTWGKIADSLCNDCQSDEVEWENYQSRRLYDLQEANIELHKYAVKVNNTLRAYIREDNSKVKWIVLSVFFILISNFLQLVGAMLRGRKEK